MQPEIRISDHVCTIPQFYLERSNVKGFLGVLKDFHAEFRDCFAREEARYNLYFTVLFTSSANSSESASNRLPIL